MNTQGFFNGQLSINRADNSPFWMVTFKGADGKVRRRSTKVPADGGLFNGEKLTKAQAKKRALAIGIRMANVVAEEIESVKNMTVKDACADWLGAMSSRMISIDTKRNANTAIRIFLSWAGALAGKPIREFTRANARDFVDWRRAQVRCHTVKKDLQAVSSVFARAMDAEMIARNPFHGISVPPDTKDEKVQHEAFTADELRLLIQKLPDEWSSAVRCSFELYGQRLGDVLELRWDQFDFDAGVVRIVTGKTGRVMVQPMRPDFASWAWARMLAVGGEYVHPHLRTLPNPSTDFTSLVRMHGIGLVGVELGGRRRVWHSKTFHSIRASVATLLQVGGVPQNLTMHLVGHDSSTVHAAYIRPNLDQLREAGEKLPKL